ncbi:hypothetical protein ACLQ24_30410, partial [Micromonospora sp. DT4]|uniref:hypothetical protein n=1 Tax=Micromonospora sp. DT4 TaxID=3393438 RepID=UPI003CF9A98F
FIENNRNKLTVEQKQHWVDAIAKLGKLPVMENNVDQLQELTRGVLNCVKNPTPESSTTPPRGNQPNQP